jgi:hypothetical protein
VLVGVHRRVEWSSAPPRADGSGWVLLLFDWGERGVVGGQDLLELSPDHGCAENGEHGWSTARASPLTLLALSVCNQKDGDGGAAENAIEWPEGTKLAGYSIEARLS